MNWRIAVSFVFLLTIWGCSSESVPHLTTLTPASAPSGHTVTVKGSGFGSTIGTSRLLLTAIDDAKLIDLTAVVQGWSNTEVTFRVPADLAEQSYVLHIERDRLSSNGLKFTNGLLPDPTIDVVAPAVARLGDEVTLSGATFGEKQGKVLFWPDVVATITSWSDSMIVFTVPSGALLSNSLRVETETGYLSGWSDFLVADPSKPTLTLIQKTIFTPKCSQSSCHGIAASAGLNLTEGASFRNLVGVKSSKIDQLLVDSTLPLTSFLIEKLSKNPAVGAQMPKKGGYLSAEEIKLISDWIALGALDN